MANYSFKVGDVFYHLRDAYEVRIVNIDVPRWTGAARRIYYRRTAETTNSAFKKLVNTKDYVFLRNFGPAKNG